MLVLLQENRSALWLISKYNIMEGNQVGQEKENSLLSGSSSFGASIAGNGHEHQSKIQISEQKD